jgi:hypothetical protein
MSLPAPEQLEQRKAAARAWFDPGAMRQLILRPTAGRD